MSDFEDDDGVNLDGLGDGSGNGQSLDKRAHHNALERKRRDHIKESFSGEGDVDVKHVTDRSVANVNHVTKCIKSFLKSNFTLFKVVIKFKFDCVFFSGLRDAIPTLAAGDKSSRAQILKKASEYIAYMRKKTTSHQRDIDDLKTQNGHLEAQIRALERAKNSGSAASPKDVLSDAGLLDADAGEIVEQTPSTTPSTAATQIIQVLPPPPSNTASIAATSPTGRIQPGQSLLISTPSGGEPVKKRMRT